MAQNKSLMIVFISQGKNPFPPLTYRLYALTANLSFTPLDLMSQTQNVPNEYRFICTPYLRGRILYFSIIFWLYFFALIFILYNKRS